MYYHLLQVYGDLQVRLKRISVKEKLFRNSLLNCKSFKIRSTG